MSDVDPRLLQKSTHLKKDACENAYICCWHVHIKGPLIEVMCLALLSTNSQDQKSESDIRTGGT